MAEFVARVELQDIGAGDQRPLYEKLHEYMALEGYVQTVKSLNGERHLPDATYYLNKDTTVDDALEAARRAAGKTQKKYGVFVALITTWTSAGLKPVEKKS